MYNLIEILPKEDKEKIEKYIQLYGVREHFIGVDHWLTYWSKNKPKLYKLLGEKFIHKIPYTYEINEGELRHQVAKLLGFPFISDFIDWYANAADINLIYSLRRFTYVGTYLDDKIDFDLKFKKEDAKKELRLSKGMKPLKALSKIAEYFKDDPKFPYDKFEEFRLAHSRVNNGRKIKGSLVFSIHPLDYVTMSDNAYDWQSCMNWRNSGCYRVGTIEMMNSNNVICCYLEGKEPFEFAEGVTWSNKKWRQLAYLNKDIIVSGKAYPYQSKELSQVIVEELRRLAKENLNWDYAFGTELYKDMIEVNELYDLEQIRDNIYNNSTQKKIVFDTKGMYNDMLNDSDIDYWCVRNKVKHNKIYSYSGKANCLCCNGSILDEVDDYCDDYNDRYSNTANVICSDCQDLYFNCEHCGLDAKPTDKFYTYINEEGEEKKICETCWRNYMYYCPCCSKPMDISTGGHYVLEYNGDFQEIPQSEAIHWSHWGRPYQRTVHLHDECGKKLGFKEQIDRWYSEFVKGIYSKEELEIFKGFYRDELKEIPPQNGLNLKNN